MTRNGHRKPTPPKTPASIKKPAPKRPRTRTEEVFAILGEEGAGGPEGWFSVPWRNATCVVEMLVEIYQHKIGIKLDVTQEEIAALRILDTDWFDASAEYSACEETRAQLATCQAPQPRTELLATALRARQLAIAHSDGGGHAYNALLLNRWRLFDVDDADVALIVRDARCEDAVPVDERRRRAFKEAWSAGLYQAAYALG